jgi:hypothetical protein
MEGGELVGGGVKCVVVRIAHAWHEVPVLSTADRQRGAGSDDVQPPLRIEHIMTSPRRAGSPAG